MDHPLWRGIWVDKEGIGHPDHHFLFITEVPRLTRINVRRLMLRLERRVRMVYAQYAADVSQDLIYVEAWDAYYTSDRKS